MFHTYKEKFCFNNNQFLPLLYFIFFQTPLEVSSYNLWNINFFFVILEGAFLEATLCSFIKSHNWHSLRVKWLWFLVGMQQKMTKKFKLQKLGRRWLKESWHLNKNGFSCPDIYPRTFPISILRTVHSNRMPL